MIYFFLNFSKYPSPKLGNEFTSWRTEMGGVWTLTFHEKEESKIEQPKNVIEGVGKGAVSFGKGLFG